MRVYNDQFRSDAINMCKRGDRPLRHVAADLGVSRWTLRGWVQQDQDMAKSKKRPPKLSAPSGPETPEETIKRLQGHVAKLERENAQLQMDREILKKAAAFFAKENE